MQTVSFLNLNNLCKKKCRTHTHYGIVSMNYVIHSGDAATEDRQETTGPGRVLERDLRLSGD